MRSYLYFEKLRFTTSPLSPSPSNARFFLQFLSHHARKMSDREALLCSERLETRHHTSCLDGKREYEHVFIKTFDFLVFNFFP